MAIQPTIDFCADRLEAMRENADYCGDGMVDDMMLAGEVEQLFERALSVCGVSGEALKVMQLRIRCAAIDAVDLVTEDFRRRDLLA